MTENKEERRGLGTALVMVSAFFGALFLIPFKAAGARAPQEAVVLGVLIGAAVLSTPIALVRSRGRLRCGRADLLAGVVLACCAVLGNIGVGGSLARLEPAVTSTILQVQIILIALAEVFFLKLRLTGALSVGIALALVGIVVVQAPWAAERAGDPVGLAWAFLAAVSFATMLLYTRMVVTRIDVITVNMLRLWLGSVMLACWPGAVAGVLAFDAWQWVLCVAAGACGLTISRLLLMWAVRHISASEAKLTGLVGPVFALVLGVLVFGSWPGPRECLGGLIILGGVALPLAAQRLRRSGGIPPTA